MKQPITLMDSTENILSRRIEELETENAQLRSENQYLREELSGFKATLEAKIAQAVAQATAPLKLEISRLTQENLKLKAMLDKNSGNSSKPPSSDRFSRSKKPIPNNRQSTGRSPGGQDGHEGHRLAMPSQEELIEMIEDGAARVEVVDHTGGSSDFVEKWEIEIDIVTVFKRLLLTVNSKSKL